MELELGLAVNGPARPPASRAQRSPVAGLLCHVVASLTLSPGHCGRGVAKYMTFDRQKTQHFGCLLGIKDAPISSHGCPDSCTPCSFWDEPALRIASACDNYRRGVTRARCRLSASQGCLELHKAFTHNTLAVAKVGCAILTSAAAQVYFFQKQHQE